MIPVLGISAQSWERIRYMGTFSKTTLWRGERLLSCCASNICILALQQSCLHTRVPHPLLVPHRRDAVVMHIPEGLQGFQSIIYKVCCGYLRSTNSDSGETCKAPKCAVAAPKPNSLVDEFSTSSTRFCWISSSPTKLYITPKLTQTIPRSPEAVPEQMDSLPRPFCQAPQMLSQKGSLIHCPLPPPMKNNTFQSATSRHL